LAECSRYSTYGVLWRKVDLVRVEVLEEGAVHGEGEVPDLDAARLIRPLLPVLLCTIQEKSDSLARSLDPHLDFFSFRGESGAKITVLYRGRET